MTNPTNSITHPSISAIKNNGKTELWFKELSPLWPGEARTLLVKEILLSEKSSYQDILIFSSSYGNVLVLDGVIQCTERDEFAYQEMITGLGLSGHGSAKSKEAFFNFEGVLVVGGGDGGVLREVIKWNVERVVLCEIDEAVINTSKKYLKEMAKGFDSEKVEVYIGDGFEYLKKCEKFDVIITDSSDPIGPAESLFQPDYFKLLKSALNTNGVIVTQAESIWLHLDLITGLIKSIKDLFSVEYAVASVPTYPSGQIGFLVLSDKENKVDVKKAKNVPNGGFRYYCEDVHEAAFVLPVFAWDAIEAAKK